MNEAIYHWINFLLLAGALGYLGRKPLAEFFTQRSAAVRKALDEGRKALESSQAQLSAVEAKLRHLEEEIAAFKASAAREMESERQRLREAAAAEAERIRESTRAQMELALRSAKLELRIQAAHQAVELAEEVIRQRLDDAGRSRLFRRFIAGLKYNA
jgi:F-type H+-transporting ATPase subunit b